MGSLMMTIMLFIGITALASLLFGGWLLVSVVRMLGRGIGFLLGPGRGTVAEMLPGAVDRRCGNLACRAANPVSARFCRRCGRSTIGVAATTGSQQRPPRVPTIAARWDSVGELSAGERNRI
jgi:hypothetical protein